MNIAARNHTLNNKKRWEVNYKSWLPEGVTIASATATSSSATATVNGVAHTATKLIFFTNAGVLNETFTVAVQITDTIGQIKNDTISFTVIAA